MNFLAPHFLWVAAAVSIAVAAIHFIVTRQPRSEPFPTARFVPESTVQAVSRAKDPTDLLVLLLRILAIMCVGAALAKPVISPQRAPVARIILADISRSSKSVTDVRDSVLRYHHPNDLLIAFDSTARIVNTPDSLVHLGSLARAGNFSAALVAAIRASSVLRERADSVSLILVSALPQASFNAAADTIRSMWPGGINIIRVAPSVDSIARTSSPVSVNFAAADPLRYAVTLAGRMPHAPAIRIVRAEPVNGTAVSGDTVVLYWPDHARPFLSRPGRSERTALVSDDAVVVSHFSTRWEFPPDSLRGVSVIARWEDGAPAAVQRNVGSGCIRSVGIPVPARGDLVIWPEFIAMVSRLLQPCAGTGPLLPLAPDAYLTRLKGGTNAAPRQALPASPSSQSPYSVWLLLAAIGFLALEQISRRSWKGAQAHSPRSEMRAAA